jgi:hypothetical protein
LQRAKKGFAFFQPETTITVRPVRSFVASAYRQMTIIRRFIYQFNDLTMAKPVHRA